MGIGISLHRAVASHRWAAIPTCAEYDIIYNSPPYHAFLQEITRTASPWILQADYEGHVIATLRFYTLEWNGYNILNSNPYFGSHGGPVVSADVSGSQQRQTLQALGAAFSDFVDTHGIDAVNLVEYPWQSVSEFAQAAKLEHWDRRIGQISTLPTWQGRAKTSDLILQICKQKTRNLLRKGLKQNFKITVETSQDAWMLLYEHHQISMSTIGGRAKQWTEFLAMQRHLEAAGATRLYIARHEGDFAGALLVLTHKAWVEYFIPVPAQAFRSAQVLSALIHHAMLDACEKGQSFWNWGGTWQSQSGVHKFKSGWGSNDVPYGYWGRISERMRRLDVAGAGGPPDYFYVKPFGDTNAA
jgi:hypothetical protein